MFKASLFVFMILATQAFCQCPDYSYSGSNGPEFWGSLCTDYATCGSGTVQSPINLSSDGSGSTSNNFSVDVEQVDEEGSTFFHTGHTVEVEFHVETHENEITYNNAHYDLAQFHFHTPSENTLDNVNYDAEVHFVHVNDNGDLLVLGVLIEAGDDDEHCDFLTQLEDSIPQVEGEEHEVDIHSFIEFDGTTDYFTFLGSLTTPPCTEGVRWIIRREPLVCGSSQVAAFSSVLGSNNRPIQSKNSRTVEINFAADVSSGSSTSDSSTSNSSTSNSSTSNTSTSNSSNTSTSNTSNSSTSNTSNSSSSNTSNSNSSSDSSSASVLFPAFLLACIVMFI